MNNKFKSLLCVAYLVFFYYASLAYRPIVLTFLELPLWVMSDTRAITYVLGYLLVYVPLTAYAIYFLVRALLPRPTP